MGIPLTSDSRRGQNLLTRLLAGRPFGPEGGAWPADDLLQLAGACLHLLSTREDERRGVDGFPERRKPGGAAP